MKSFPAILFITCLLAIHAFAGPAVNQQWQDWKREHNKLFANKYEDKLRQQIFMTNLNKIQTHNRQYDQGLKTFRVKLNKFADMTLKEFSQKYTSNTFERRHSAPIRGEDWKRSKNHNDGDPLPESIDWRELGAVTPVKEQGFCAASHVYAEVAMLEALSYQMRGQLMTLSEQNVIECAWQYPVFHPMYNLCTNGTVGDAYMYVMENHGIDKADGYPNVDQIQQCHYDKTNIGISIGSWVQWWPKNETDLQTVIALSPASVLIDASSWEFMFYSGGVYTDDKCVEDQPSLAVAVVGYDQDDDGSPYWIMKNSWGTSWGMDGYMQFARGMNNMCGVASDFSWVG